jgi:hypothetical protein
MERMGHRSFQALKLLVSVIATTPDSCTALPSTSYKAPSRFPSNECLQPRISRVADLSPRFLNGHCETVGGRLLFH